MKKLATLLYGFAAYAGFLAVFLYLLGFLVDAPFLPRTMNSAIEAPLGTALAVNLGLILLFGLQHSVMARPSFKRWLTRYLSPAVERSTYVMASNVVMALMLWQWHAIPTTIWEVTSPAGRIAIWSLMGVGVGGLLLATFLINHFELFGLQQVVNHAFDKPTREPAFATRLFYRLVRHPLYVGWLTLMFCTPHMTVGHAAFFVGFLAYIRIAVYFEERDLVAKIPQYASYREQVPMLVPSFKPYRAERAETTGGVAV